ncbi:hypothetical protein HQ531_07765 [bacterium]|nr:hypothetical protein [bacterium]
MRGLKKITLILIIVAVAFFLVQNCEENSLKTNEGENGSIITGEPQYQHIAFRVTCGNPASGVEVAIKIFERESQQVVDQGNTDSNGNYCSSSLDSEQWYKIQIYELPENTCVNWVKDVSIYNNPDMWYPECTTTDLGRSHMGGTCDGWEETWGCW